MTLCSEDVGSLVLSLCSPQSMKPGLAQPCPAVVLEEDKKAVKRNKQEEHKEDYHKALISISEMLRETEGPDMKEMMKDQIRQWFIECQ